MPGSISSFRASFKKDVSRASRFDVSIPIPIPLILAGQVDSQQLSFRCESAEMPGRSFETVERRIGSSPNEKYPYQSSYGESNMTFICSDDMSEKTFFDSWMDLVNPPTDFNFQYKSNYAVDMFINQYDVQNNLTYSAKLIEAYPISIEPITLDWTSDSYNKLVVVFAFSYWVGNYQNVLQDSIVNAASTGLLNNITS